MKPHVAALVLCPWLALSAWSQTTTPLPKQPPTQLQVFLGLTDSQVFTILQNNGEYNTFSFQQQLQIQNAQTQISVETAKDQIDPFALGTLYAGIEGACRDLRNKAATAQTQNLSILTDAQRAKVNTLNDAMKLAPTISDAQLWNLLGSANSLSFAVNPFFGNIVAPIGLLPVPGCLAVRNGDFSQALSQARQFLGLADSQVTAILQDDTDFNTYSLHQLEQIRQVQSQIAVETAKDTLDPTTIGNLYAGIETTCRGLREKSGAVQQQNVSLLTDGQKVKLNTLNDAMKLAPVISEAQYGNLLGSTNSPPFAFSAFSSSILTNILVLPAVPGCGAVGVIGGIISPVPIPPPPAQPGPVGVNTTPAPANRTSNQWFDRD